MKKLIVCALASLSAATLFSAENLLKNGTFEQMVAGSPAAWFTKAKGGITYSGDGAPESGYVKFDLVKDGKAASANISQVVAKVVKSSGKYTISFKARTKNFKGMIRVLAINDGWQNGDGLAIGGRFPKDWQEYKKNIVMPEFKKDARVVIMVSAKQGTVEIADVKLVPIETAI